MKRNNKKYFYHKSRDQLFQSSIERASKRLRLKITSVRNQNRNICI